MFLLASIRGPAAKISLWPCGLVVGGGGNMLLRYGICGDLGELGTHLGPAERGPSRLADRAFSSKE